MRAHIALLWLLASGFGAACSADFAANHSTRCDEATACPITEACYRGFCVQGRGLPIEVDGSLSPITEVEAGATADLPGGGEAGTIAVLADAQSPAVAPPLASGDGGASAANDAGPPSVVPATPEDAAAPPSPATPPTTTPPAVDPAPVIPAPTTPEPTTPAPTTPAPTTPAPTTPTTPEPTPPVTPAPVIDAGAPEASVPTPPTMEPESSSPLLLCLAVCLTRSQLCFACLAGSITNDPSVCEERQVRGDRELRELCDWLCASGDCRGAR